MKLLSLKNIGVSILLALIFVSISSAQSVLAPTGKWVTDNGNMLTPSEERALTNKLEVYARNTSTQIVIVTLADLAGQEIALYATELGQNWRIGQDGKDNGAVILVSRDDRKVYIATGYGLEGAIPDAVAGRIIREVIVPNFREGAVYRGLSAAVDRLVSAAAGEYTAEGGGQTQQSNTRSQSSGSGLIRLIFIVIFIIVMSRGGGGRGRGRRGGVYPIFFGGGGGFSSGGGFGGGFGGFSGGGGGFGGGGAGGSW